MADPQLSPCTNFFATLINFVINILSLFLPKSTVELMKNFTSTLPRDLRFFYKYLKVVLITLFHQKTNKTVIDLFDQNVRMWPNKLCFIFEGSEWSFKEVDMYSRRVTQVFKGKVAKGDVVALFMTSRAHYVPIWLGLGRLGVTTALLNTNQKNKPLVHSITTARPKLIIFSPDMAPGLTDVAEDIDATIKLFCFGKTTCMFDYTDLQELITNSDPDYSPGPKINSSDTLLYIFTSGSSGLPKPAVMPHCRQALIIGA